MFTLASDGYFQFIIAERAVCSVCLCILCASFALPHCFVRTLLYNSPSPLIFWFDENENGFKQNRELRLFLDIFSERFFFSVLILFFSLSLSRGFLLIFLLIRLFVVAVCRCY